MINWQVAFMFAANLVTIIVAVSKGLTVLISVRDDIRELKTNVGTEHPPTGLMGDVASIRHQTSQHRDTLIEVTSELGLRRPGGRT